MKKILAILVFVLIGSMSYAQNWSAGPGNIWNVNTGNVGIGTTAPAFLFTVANPSTTATFQVERPLAAGTGNVAVMQLKNSNVGDYYYIGIKKMATGHDAVQSVYYAATNTFRAFSAINSATGKYEIRNGVGVAEFLNAGNVLFNNTGNVGIGTTNPLAKLSVNGTGTFNGKVKCTEVEVLLAAWPDRVFKAGYNLMPLEEVEAFVNANSHLPGVPSESEVLQNGVNVGDMNAVLLQKIEELTLYMIQLKKDNEQLKAQIEKLK